jgi:hypothetical protein
LLANDALAIALRAYALAAAGSAFLIETLDLRRRGICVILVTLVALAQFLRVASGGAFRNIRLTRRLFYATALAAARPARFKELLDLGRLGNWPIFVALIVLGRFRNCGAFAVPVILPQFVCFSPRRAVGDARLPKRPLLRRHACRAPIFSVVLLSGGIRAARPRHGL